MGLFMVTKAEQNNLNHLSNISESKRLLKLINVYGSSKSENVLTDTLYLLFETLKSSSFPTAVANLTNQKCVNDSLLYVHTLYSYSGSNASWARQSKKK